MGEREEVPCGTLRVDSKPGAGVRLKARVPLYMWVEGLANGVSHVRIHVLGSSS